MHTGSRNTPSDPLTAPLLACVGKKERPDSAWLYGGGNQPPHESKTDRLANEVVKAWQANAGLDACADVVASPMDRGWAGLASYRVFAPGGDKHLKIAMVKPEGQRANYEKLVRAVPGEAERAAWAGARGLGPKVVFRHAPLGAFLCDFVPGRVPNLTETSGQLLQRNLELLAKLHGQDAASVPPGGGSNWLNAGPRVEDDLNNAQDRRPQAYRHALLQIEAGLEAYLEKQPFVPVPIHDDYKPDNTLLVGDKLVLLDWNNLRTANAAIDLGHFAVMADMSANEVATHYTDAYLAAHRRSNGPLAADANLRPATQAYTGLFRLRNMAFYDQWSGTRPKTEYLRHQLADDVAALRTTVFAEIGLRPTAVAALP